MVHSQTEGVKSLCGVLLYVINPITSKCLVDLNVYVVDAAPGKQRVKYSVCCSLFQTQCQAVTSGALVTRGAHLPGVVLLKASNLLNKAIRGEDCMQRIHIHWIRLVLYLQCNQPRICMCNS